MNFEFSIGWMIAGIAIALCGGLIVLFYRQISHGMASGVASYDRVKLFGVVTIAIGLILTANLHTLILGWLVSIIFQR